MNTARRWVGAVIVAIVALSVVTLAMPVAAKVPPAPSKDSITIDNGIINITFFGETSSRAQYYPALPIPGNDHLFREEFAVKAGGNPTLPGGVGFVTQVYPALGNPDVWYTANVEFDLDGDNVNDTNVTRSIMVPSGQQYFFVRYCIENIKGASIDDFKFYQYADYDVETNFHNDEDGYDDSGDFVWAHDLGDTGITYVGFKGDLPSSKHAAAGLSTVWGMVLNDALNNNNYYAGDVAVALEWDFGTLQAGETKCLTVKFAFADSYQVLKSILGWRQVPTLTPLGLIALVCLLPVVAALTITKRKRR